MNSLLSILINPRNIFPPVLNDPSTLLRMYVRRANRPPHAYKIYKTNFTKEAKRLGFYNQLFISREASLYWSRSTSQEKRLYTQLADAVKRLYFQRFPRRSFHVAVPARPMVTNNNNVTSATLASTNPSTTLLGQPTDITDNTIDDVIHNGLVFNGDNELNFGSLDHQLIFI